MGMGMGRVREREKVERWLLSKFPTSTLVFMTQSIISST